MYLVEFFTVEDDVAEAVFAKLPTDSEIIEYIELHDWLSVEYRDDGLTWAVTPVDFVNNIPEESKEED